MNVSHVDFFVLDIEMVEEPVLQNFPFHEITVDVWAIEHRIEFKIRRFLNYKESEYSEISLHDLELKGYPQEIVDNRKRHLAMVEDQVFIKFMIDQGYYYFDTTCTYIGDYVFIRKKSELFAKLKVPLDQLNRTTICEYKEDMLTARYHFEPANLRDKHHYPNLEFKTFY